MSNFHLEVITNKKVVFKEEVEKVVVPSVKGSLCILPHHEPYFVVLKKGTVKIFKKGQTKEISILKGYLKVSFKKTIIYIEKPEERKEDQKRIKNLAERKKISKADELILLHGKNEKGKSVYEKDFEFLINIGFQNFIQDFSPKLELESKEQSENLLNIWVSDLLLKKILNDLTGKNVLIVGSSLGYLSTKLSEKVKNITVVDDTELNITECIKRNVKSNVHFEKISYEESLPYSSESFDLIISQFSLERINNLSFIADEFDRILKKYGQIVVSLYHPLLSWYLSIQEEKELSSQEINRTYFDKYKILKAILKSGDYTFYHRPLDDYLNVFLLSNFVVSRFMELELPTSYLQNNLQSQRYEGLPIVLIYRLERQKEKWKWPFSI